MSEKKYCGNCLFFVNEDIGGEGLCSHSSSPFVTLCGRKACKYHVERKQNPNNGWTEITQDNEEEVYNVPVNRLVIGWVQAGVTVCRLYQDVSPTISTMAKLRDYYYFVLPEIKIGNE